MATVTFGTTTTSKLPIALQWQPGGISAADMAALNAAIKRDDVPNKVLPTAVESGRLFLPQKRGLIILQPGDWIAVGSNGWPIVVSSKAQTADWAHS